LLTVFETSDCSTTVEASAILGPEKAVVPATKWDFARSDRGLLLLAEIWLMLALSMSLLTMGGNVLAADIGVGKALQGTSISFEATIAAFGNHAGSAVFGVPVGIAVAALLLWRRQWIGTLTISVALLARLLNTPLKELFESPRPTSGSLRITEHASGYGFPSGHAMGIVLAAGSIALGVTMSVRSRRVAIAVWTAALLVILATGYGRIRVGAHWPSDVLGGYLWGAFLLTVAVLVARAISSMRGRPLR
jgi:membrane-associated phospholipid phosphatase